MKNSYLIAIMTGCIVLSAACIGVSAAILKGRASSGEKALHEEAFQEESDQRKERREEVEETEGDPAQKQIKKIQSALGGMPYYGDKANCKMTAEQATAFAQLIADGLAGDFGFRGGYDERFDITSWNDTFRIYTSDLNDPNEVDRFNVMLGDFSYDGIPYLYVYSSSFIKNHGHPSFEIYGWKDNTAKLVADTHSGTSTIAWEIYNLYEDENNQIKLLFETGYGIGEGRTLYFFSEGTMKESYAQQAFFQDGLWHVTENGVETGAYTEQEYYTGHEVLMMDAEELKKNHTHILPYTCFYDMQPCTLEEMVNYLNAYALAMSDGQAVPVEIKKPDTVKHEGTGIITKGEVPQGKVDSLEILRQYMNGEKTIGVADSSIFAYTDIDVTPGEPEAFYFGFTDLNQDGNQELLVSYKADYGSNTDVFLPSLSKDALTYLSLQGMNQEEGTYLMLIGSVTTGAYLYVYDGTAFSQISSLDGDDTADEFRGSLTQNGETRELSKDEFYAIYKNWNDKHTDLGANTHLDIENIENTFHVKIDVQNSGEWLVTDAE